MSENSLLSYEVTVTGSEDYDLDMGTGVNSTRPTTDKEEEK